jgi:tetratricopeptide (TPR) repeat protein
LDLRSRFASFEGAVHDDAADPVGVVSSTTRSVPEKRSLSTGRVLTWAVAAAAVVVSCFFVSESDFFMHLRNGERILESGRLERSEVYSYTTTETEFPNHEWLSNVVMALMWRAGGFDLLVAAKALAAGVLVLLLAASARARGARGLAVPLALLVGVVLMRFRLYTRPEIFTLLFLPVVDLLCLGALASPPRRRVWLIPVGCVVWANLHPGVVLAPIVIATHGIGALLSGRLPLLASRGLPRDGRRLLLVAAACVPAMMVTPYGAGIFTPLIRIATSDTIRAAAVREWLPPTFADFQVFFGVLVAGSVLLIAVSRRVAAADMALWFGFALLALRSLRHVGVFAVVGAPVLAWALTAASAAIAAASSRFTPTLGRFVNPTVRTTVVAVLIVAATAGLLSPRASFLHQDQSRHYRFGLGLDNLTAPIASVDLLEEWELPGPLYNSWGFGGYLMWRVWPRLQVFADGRDYMYVDLYKELQSTPFDVVVASRGVRTFLIAHDDIPGLDFVHRAPDKLLVAFDDRAQLWTDRSAVAARPSLRPLEHLRPESLSLDWYRDLSPEEQREAERSAILAVERASGHARPWALLGQVQRRRGQVEQAVLAYERAVSLDRGQASYANNLGACLLDTGNTEKAAAWFRSASRFDPEMFSAHLNLGQALLMLGDPGGAIAALRRAHEVDPGRAEPFYLLGVAESDPKRAGDYFRRYLDLDPGGPWAADARARLGSN